MSLIVFILSALIRHCLLSVNGTKITKILSKINLVQIFWCIIENYSFSMLLCCRHRRHHHHCCSRRQHCRVYRWHFNLKLCHLFEWDGFSCKTSKTIQRYRNIYMCMLYVYFEWVGVRCWCNVSHIYIQQQLIFYYSFENDKMKWVLLFVSGVVVYERKRGSPQPSRT